jgi:hypothetical protein
MDLAECPHCFGWLSRRQIDRHLAALERDFDMSSSDVDMSDSGDPDTVNDRALRDPGTIENPGAIDDHNAVVDLGADDNVGSGSEHNDGGTLVVYY